MVRKWKKIYNNNNMYGSRPPLPENLAPTTLGCLVRSQQLLEIEGVGC